MKRFTYTTLEQDIKNITQQFYIQKYYPDLIIGLSRGGLIPAVYLSHWTNAKMITLEKNGHRQIIEDVQKANRILVVDDINDTGKTLKDTLEFINAKNKKSCDVKTCCLIDNLSSRFKIDFCGIEINKYESPCWVVFPWESINE